MLRGQQKVQRVGTHDVKSASLGESRTRLSVLNCRRNHAEISQNPGVSPCRGTDVQGDEALDAIREGPVNELLDEKAPLAVPPMRVLEVSDLRNFGSLHSWSLP